MVTSQAPPVSSSSTLSSRLSKKDVIKPSSWKGLTFADFDKSPMKPRHGGKKRSSGWMLLATAQLVDLGSPSSSRKKKKKKKTIKETTTNDTIPAGGRSDKDTSKTTAKSLTRLSQRALGKYHPLDNDTSLHGDGDKPVSTSELTAATVTMTGSERSEEDLPLIPVVTKLSMIEDSLLGAVVDSDSIETILTENEAAALNVATPTKKTKTKKNTVKTPSPEKKKKKTKSTPTTTTTTTKKKKKVKKSPSPSKKKKSKKPKVGDVADIDALVEERLQEIDRLERILEEERRGLQSKRVSISWDQEIMRYVIHQEAERTDELAQTIEGLQEQVVRMQQQELAILQQETNDLDNVQVHIQELEDLVQKQANEIERLKKEIWDIDQAAMVVDEKDLFDDVQTLVEENKTLLEGKKSMIEEHEGERKKWQESLDVKDEMIASLQQEIKSLKAALDNAPLARNEEKVTKGMEGELMPQSPETFPSTPKAPKSAKKEKVSLHGMNIDALKPPLDGIL
ncbi:hypothetical protein IV203_004122 [Nitzschia inconspicua]|uniref:Uncharacterized protein n=1 Tax=Nitzschia inconspicua TaxID=303405 RepID=A0A9K3L4U5_9STRA|nr:hypothetical protein IV203_004122 [Nitzschia inconspicua]